MKRLAGCCILKIECFCFNEGISDSEHNRKCEIPQKKKDQTPADASVSGDGLAQDELHHCSRLDDKVVHQIRRNRAREEGESFSDSTARKSSAERRFQIEGFIY